MQRYRCLQCGKTFSDSQPVAGVRVEFSKAVQVVHLLCEGMGIRAIARFTGLDEGTILNVLESTGQHCVSVLDSKIRDVVVQSVQADELFSFVYCKQYNNLLKDPTKGEQYTYLAVDRDSKLILSHYTGKRCADSTDIFVADLRKRIKGRAQVTTDGLQSYVAAFYDSFGGGVDFAQQSKTYFNYPVNSQDHRRYSSRGVQSVKTMVHIGAPDPRLISTSHVERTNLSVRLFNRRFTRLTLGYSKKLQNLKYGVALFIAHFNFCRVHSSHKTTPAQAAGLADHKWTIEELLRQ